MLHELETMTDDDKRCTRCYDNVMYSVLHHNQTMCKNNATTKVETDQVVEDRVADDDRHK